MQKLIHEATCIFHKAPGGPKCAQNALFRPGFREEAQGIIKKIWKKIQKIPRKLYAPTGALGDLKGLSSNPKRLLKVIDMSWGLQNTSTTIKGTSEGR